MSSARWCSSLVVLCLVACGPAPEDPALSVSPDRSSFDGRVDRVILKVRGWAVGGSPAEGLVRLSAPVGRFVGGDTVVLADGFATATYACNPDEEPACNGTLRLAAEWNEVRASTQVSIVSPPVITPVRFEIVPTHVVESLEAIATSPDGVVWAVGERGVVLRLEGRAWQRVTSPTREGLHALAFDRSGAPVIVGDAGTLLRWSLVGLERVRLETKGDLTAVAIDADGVVLVGGRDGVLSRLEEGALVPELELRTPILALARQGDDVWSGGDNVLARRSQAQWLNLPLPVSARFTFAQPGKEILWLGGERPGVSGMGGVIVAGPMPTWRSAAFSQPVRALTEVPGSGERFALTSASLHRQVASGEWQVIDAPAPTRAMTSRGPGDLVLVGPSGFSLLRTP